MRMHVKRDDTVRTIVVEIEDGPALEAGWATWRTKPRPFRLQQLRVTIDAGQFRAAVLSGHLILKGGRLSESLTDAVSLHDRDLEREPAWIRTLVLDAISNVKNATYPPVEDHTVGGQAALS